MSLFQAPPFAALSYCWGNLSDKASITVNGQEVRVTVNLHSALKRLREERVQRIWVDALCINQQDDEERSYQVKRMDTIFQQANQVVVWLGDTDDMTKEDINSLSTKDAAAKDAAAKADAAKAADAKAADAAADEYAAEYAAKATAKDAAAKDAATIHQVWSDLAQPALLRLLLRPYWTRVWIIQELAVASKITVFCGDYKFSWEDFENLSPLTFTAGIDRTDSDDSKAIFQNLLQFRIDRLATKPVRLLETLYRSRYALSTDPKDKIYGLLGLAHDGRALIPEPNYSQSVKETYTDFSKGLIKKCFPLDLIYLRTSHRGISDSLPSWVVDWRDLNDALAKQGFKRIQASIKSDLSNQPDQASFSNNKLTVRGIIRGTIDGMGSAFFADGNNIMGHVVPPEGVSSVPLDFDPSTYVFNALLETQRSPATTTELPLNPIGLWSSNKKTELEKLFRGYIKPNELEALSKWIDANRSFIAFGKTLGIWNGIWTSQPMNTDRNTRQDTYLRLLVNIILTGMRIATLRTGELGWVHPQSQKGDTLCEVLGCDSYVVLRPAMTSFQVVGEARFAGGPVLSNKVENLTIF